MNNSTTQAATTSGNQNFAAPVCKGGLVHRGFWWKRTQCDQRYRNNRREFVFAAEYWAFTEWDACDHGGGDYREREYLEKEQCDSAVTYAAAKRGERERVAKALSEQREAMKVAGAKVQPLWPMSVLVGTFGWTWVLR